ncbi:transposase-like protein [Arthrobacter sp. CAN_C5]|nr:transposase-like protein [Arthrobacter sp. CAN_C5]
MLTEIGPVEIEEPRDREGSFEPVIVPKRKGRLDGIDQVVLSLSAHGLTTGEIAAHVEEVYGAKVLKDTISRITEKVAGELAEWSFRPLDPLYPVLFVDAMVGVGPRRAGAQHPVLRRHGLHDERGTRHSRDLGQ